MAKLEKRISGSFDEILSRIENGILDGSISATLEDVSNFTGSCMRVFERYSYLGKNRVSMSVTLYQENGGDICLSAITSGGSQAMFFKINTFGEEAFLDKLRELI